MTARPPAERTAALKKTVKGGPTGACRRAVRRRSSALQAASKPTAVACWAEKGDKPRPGFTKLTEM